MKLDFSSNLNAFFFANCSSLWMSQYKKLRYGKEVKPAQIAQFHMYGRYMHTNYGIHNLYFIQIWHAWCIFLFKLIFNYIYIPYINIPFLYFQSDWKKQMPNILSPAYQFEYIKHFIVSNKLLCSCLLLIYTCSTFSLLTCCCPIVLCSDSLFFIYKSLRRALIYLFLDLFFSLKELKEDLITIAYLKCWLFSSPGL